ncbi:sensor histidine kinase [Leeuwenhoekiella parthenopeia]|uniref:HAMP domain-containing histidine kinase n=1 Tax=Leeuwenhoekiella parthenopeia TaxID=2890320 RepID=A0ABS8GWV7_9FLAO|nr:HAMP domain-containing sensor histidine kinase [Leeuwenhoekiella parthenopeia]MCC4214422.1 HAMP domain-containing histidine kinase [Leeuwenhoekiella parthenopeia]
MSTRLSKTYFLEALNAQMWKASNILIWGSIFFMIFISILDFLLIEDKYIILTFLNGCTLILIATSNYLLTKILKKPTLILHIVLVLLSFLFLYSMSLTGAMGYYLYLSLICLAFIAFNSIAVWTLGNAVFQCFVLSILLITMDYFKVLHFSELEHYGVYTTLAVVAFSITFPSLKMLSLVDDLKEFYRLKQEKKEVSRLNLSLQKENDIQKQKLNRYENSAKVFRHDLKNKLGSIESLIELIELEDQYHLLPGQNDYLDMIKNSLVEASGEHTFFKTFMEEAEEQIVLNKSMVDLHELVKNSRLKLFEKTSSQNIKLDIDLKAANSLIYVDQNLANSAIYNLMNYAIRFSRNNDTLMITSRNTQDVIMLEIVNTMTGLPMAQLESYFKNLSYYQLEDKQNNKGLGLSIAKNNIELLDGHLRYSSSTTLGFEFLIEFPQNANLN